MLRPGDTFPPFSLQDQDGLTHTNASVAGKRFVMYFYPKDDTPGCTAQACGLRDSYEALKGLPLFGVSPDTVKKHKQFALKFSLPFVLLADPERTLIEPCGVWAEKSMYGKKYMGIARTTFVVGPDGKVEDVWEKVDVTTHAGKILELLK